MYKISSDGTRYAGLRGAIQYLNNWKQIAKQCKRPFKVFYGGNGEIKATCGCVIWIRWHNKGSQYQQLAMTQNWITKI